jgi:hypothetical protein
LHLGRYQKTCRYATPAFIDLPIMNMIYFE